MGAKQIKVFRHNINLFSKLLKPIYPNRPEFELSCSLEDGVLRGTFSKLSDTLKSANGIAGVMVVKQLLRRTDVHLSHNFGISNDYLGETHVNFSFADGFSLALPAPEGKHSPADLFWELIISEGTVANVICMFEISKLVGIKSGR